MRRRAALILTVTAAAACMTSAPSAGAVAARPSGSAQPVATSGPWENAQEVPGTAALNLGGDAEVTSVSCASPGNCSAGGYYASPTGVSRAFVVSEVRGRWQKAEQVPGTASFNKDGNAEVSSVSCAPAGNCSAGGSYDEAGVAFVVSEVNGTWRKAEEVPGTAALDVENAAATNSVSCASAGNCSAGGYYQDGSHAYQAFVASEIRGRWRKAEEVPGTAALNKTGFAETISVSCAAPGNCAAGGYYDGAGQAFVVSEVNGTWRKAEEVPGTAALNAGITSVSCASAGNCSAGGAYVDRSHVVQAFVVGEVRGTWRRAETVPGTAVLGKHGLASVTTVSCASAGNCSAGGYYGPGPRTVAFVVSEVRGHWRRAETVPGTAHFGLRRDASVTSVSCASAGNCSAGGWYAGRPSQEGFVVSEVNGRWRGAEAVPGVAALGKGLAASIFSVSCGSAGHCSAGGWYGLSAAEALVISRK